MDETPDDEDDWQLLDELEDEAGAESAESADIEELHESRLEVEFFFDATMDVPVES